MLRSLFVLIIVAGISSLSSEANAQTSNQLSAGNGKFYPYMIARGKDREIIRSMPIEQRPNRPFHFYGNTVRRNLGTSGTVGVRQNVQPVRRNRIGRWFGR